MSSPLPSQEEYIPVERNEILRVNQQLAENNTQTSNQAQVISSQGQILNEMRIQMENLSTQLRLAQDTISRLEQIPRSTGDDYHLPTRRVEALRAEPRRFAGHGENAELWIN